MENRKCMIAGLPSSGKSTYIGALWYNLSNCNDDMFMGAGKLPKNISLLQKLESLWQKGEKIIRSSSEQNIVDNILINLVMKGTSQEISLYVPDFWGEKFYNIIDKANTSEIEEWCEEADTLFYMVHDVANIVFDDNNINQKQGCHDDIPPLEVKKMSPAAINIMVLKFLFEHKKFKRLVLAVTRWDEVIEDVNEPINPEEWLAAQSPALYNFVKHYYPDVLIIGLSSQGSNYDEINFDKSVMYEKTERGKRAFVNDADGICYDLSMPLNFLLK